MFGAQEAMETLLVVHLIQVLPTSRLLKLPWLHPWERPVKPEVPSQESVPMRDCIPVFIPAPLPSLPFVILVQVS
jgi:hypothetical protein